MTKLEFISFLESSLNVSDSKDAKTVLDFFQEKFSFCASPEEEVAMIDAFGAPEHFVEKLKIEIDSLSKKGKKIKCPSIQKKSKNFQQKEKIA